MVVLVLQWFFWRTSVQTIEETFDQGIDTEATFIVETESADINLEFADIDTVNVSSLVTHGWLKTAYSYRETPNAISIDAECGWLVPECGIETTVTVPRGLAIEIHAASGNVKATGELGNTTIMTADGDVDVVATSLQALKVSTGQGDVSIEAIGARFRIEAHSVSGQVKAPASDSAAAGAIIARSSSGDVSISVGASD